MAIEKVEMMCMHYTPIHNQEDVFFYGGRGGGVGGGTSNK